MRGYQIRLTTAIDERSQNRHMSGKESQSPWHTCQHSAILRVVPNIRHGRMPFLSVRLTRQRPIPNTHPPGKMSARALLQCRGVQCDCKASVPKVVAKDDALLFRHGRHKKMLQQTTQGVSSSFRRSREKNPRLSRAPLRLLSQLGIDGTGRLKLLFELERNLRPTNAAHFERFSQFFLFA